MLPTELPLTLLCHPATPAPVVRTIEAYASWSTNGVLELAYRLRGDMARLLIPQAQPPGQVDGLWEHSCFEAFVGIMGETAYHEFNFSPSGQWAAYAFSSSHQRDEGSPLLTPPQITTSLSAGRLELTALIPATVLPANVATARLQVGLTAVVEAADIVDGSHSYWALRHTGARPDFHQRDGFALELPPPQVV